MHDPTNIAVGQLAVSHGFLTREAAFHCLNHATQRGMTFAEVARLLGALTDSKFQKLQWLSAQTSQAPSHVPSYVRPKAPPSVLDHSAVHSQTVGGLPEPGDWIGEYQIQRLLGKGGMGAVYAARRGERDYALKMILSLENPSDEIRFEREVQAAAAVDRHPNVVSVHSYDRHGVTPYAVFDMVEGVGLDELLTKGEAQDLDWTLNIVIKSLGALAHIHDGGVIHRDLKPANILIRHSDGEPLITDFGLAKQEDAEKLTRTGEMLGTPAYMAAEQMSGNPVTAAADVWAMGVILYELLTGYRPFPGSTLLEICNKVLLQDPIPPRKHVPDLDKELEVVILKCLQRDIENRYTSAQELLSDLERYQRGESIEGKLPSFDVVGTSKKFWWAGVALVLAVCFLGFGLIKANISENELKTLEAKLPEDEIIEAAIAKRLVEVSQGRMSRNAIDKVLSTRTSENLYSELNRFERQKKKLSKIQTYRRLKLLVDLMDLTDAKAERLKLVTGSWLQNYRKGGLIKGDSLDHIFALYLATQSLEALTTKDAFQRYEALPERLRRITLPLLDCLVAKGMTENDEAATRSNFKRLATYHERFNVQSWKTFLDELTKRLKKVRTDSQKAGSDKQYSKVLPTIVNVLGNVTGINLSKIGGAETLIGYERALGNGECFIALRIAHRLKVKGFWNSVPDGRLEDQLNFALSSKTAIDLDQSEVYFVLQALDLGCWIDRYAFFLQGLKLEKSLSAKVNDLYEQLKARNENAWYFLRGRIGYRNRGNDEKRDTWVKDCRLTVTQSQERLDFLKKALATPNISKSVRIGLCGLIAEGICDRAQYRAMVYTFETDPKLNSPTPANIKRSFEPEITDLGYFLSVLQVHNGSQLRRVCELKTWLIENELDYDLLKPIFRPEVRDLFNKNSLADGVAKLEHSLFPDHKPDIDVPMPLRKRRMLLLMSSTAKEQFEDARLKIQVAKQKADRQEPFDITVNEPRLFTRPFCRYLRSLKTLGYLKLALDLYDDGTKPDAVSAQDLQELRSPKIDRVSMLTTLGRFQLAIKAVDELIELERRSSKELIFTNIRPIQASLGNLVNSLRKAGKSELAHSFFNERVGGRLDLWEQSTFQKNPYIVRRLIMAEVKRGDAKAIEDLLLPVVQRCFEFSKKGVEGWRIGESYHWETRHMLNELVGHCRMLKNYQPMIQLLNRVSESAFNELWPKYISLQSALSKEKDWEKIRARVSAVNNSQILEFAFELAPLDNWVQWPLLTLVRKYQDGSRSKRLDKAISEQLKRCVMHYKSAKPTAEYKVLTLLRLIRQSPIRDVVRENFQSLDQFSYFLLKTKYEAGMYWVMSEYFTLLRQKFTDRDKLAPKYFLGRAAFILDWHLLILEGKRNYESIYHTYRRMLKYHIPLEQLKKSEIHLQNSIMSNRYSSYHYGFALLKLNKMDEFDTFAGTLKTKRIFVQYFQLLGYKHFFTNNAEGLLKAIQEVKQTNARGRMKLAVRLQGQYLIVTKQNEKYNQLKVDIQRRGGELAKLIPVWDRMIDEMKDQ